MSVEIFTKDKKGNQLKKGDNILVHKAHADAITHLDAYPTETKKQIMNGKPKNITDIIISGTRALVYIQEGADRVYFYADSIERA